MGNLSLTQYISKYRGVILKLDGLDKFQKVRGFIWGLTKDIKKMVKSQYPKTLDKAIKDAQVYDNNIDKPPKTYSHNNASSINTNKKRKILYAQGQGHKGDNKKQSKGSKGA